MPSVVRRAVRAAAVLAITAGYLAYVFRLGDRRVKDAGLGDWIDPYFINALLEHWYHVARTFADPASPPMFHPAPHVLGYSHGLILFAPFYVALRAWLHPFHAYTAAIAAVMLTGTLCLYALLRRIGRPFAEALALTALFCSSANVTNGATGVWTQRASVFLIPPILLLAAHATRRPGSPGAVLAALAGLLAGLMYVQDFYTAHFAVLLAAWMGIAVLAVDHHEMVASRARTLLQTRTRAARIGLVIAMVTVAAAVLIFLSGGGEARVLGVRLAARDWRRPAVLALIAAALVEWREPRFAAALRVAFRVTWVRACAAGAAAGLGVFVWIYLPAFREHSSFPAEEVWRALAERDAYMSYRSFVFVAAVATLAWLPGFVTDRTARLYTVWLAAGSALVWLTPLRFGDRALWQTMIRPLPGFAVIRDPSRIIYLFELAVVIGAALIVRRSGSRRYGAAVAVTALLLVLARPNHERFDYERPLDQYDRWVAAPVSIDPGCRSFFIKGASATYMSRSPHMWALYNVDAMFIALRYSIPTLNGFSAWVPDHWDLGNPQESSYPGRVRSWISRNNLTGVCELDIDARTLRPR